MTIQAFSSVPIAAIATASGRGAVGIVRVSGRGIGALVQSVCGRQLPPREAALLTFRAGNGSPIDQGLALHFPAPHSYTGEDVLELQAHGGPVVMQLLLARCMEAGRDLDIRLARPGEFTERAFLNGKIDLAQAEAIADLIDASTEAAARSATRSLTGEFSKEIESLRKALVHLRMLVEASLDFPEEDIDFVREADAAGQVERLLQQLKRVIQKTSQGALLREGLKVVIAGQPNAGKSSLLNALAGAELAIVTPIPGTTRDVVSQTIQIEGVPLHVVDTAGLRDSVDEVETIGIARAWEQIETADAVLFLHDLTRMQLADYQVADEQIAQMLSQKLPASVPVIDVWNKLDAASGDVTLRGGVALSAKRGDGLQVLRQKLLDVGGWQSQPEGVYIARERHVQALKRVGEHWVTALEVLNGPNPPLDLLAEELRLSQNALNEITGEFGSDELLGVIFSQFCIGK